MFALGRKATPDQDQEFLISNVRFRPKADNALRIWWELAEFIHSIWGYILVDNISHNVFKGCDGIDRTPHLIDITIDDA